jgi:hypothetical protein
VICQPFAPLSVSQDWSTKAKLIVKLPLINQFIVNQVPIGDYHHTTCHH